MTIPKLDPLILASTLAGIRRPSSLGASGPYVSWNSGTYSYDGAGNIKTIGAAWFAYDKVSRLVSATLYDGPTGGGNQRQQSYTFDPFGNLTNIAGSPGRSNPTSAQTNRLNGPGSTYDAAGNLKTWNGAIYEYDRFNQMSRMISGGEDWIYLYTADDERIWSYKADGTLSRWTLRDLGGQVLREYQNKASVWSLGTDYVYRDGSLLAAETPTGRRHFHLDHLGTPRLITRGSGYQAAYHVYYPFGEELTTFNQDAEKMKFTGHERDLNSPAGAGDDLDYMHARHCSPLTGRFLSVDPALESAEPNLPQSWNRYSYVQGNPLKYTDPTGEILVFLGSRRNLSQVEKVANDTLVGFDLVIDRSGRARLVPNSEAGPATSQQDAFRRTLADAISRRNTISLEVVSGSDRSSVMFGQYYTGRLDIADIARVGNGRGVSSGAILAHEIAEQTVKQSQGLPNNIPGHNRAHPFAVAANESVSGFRLASQVKNVSSTGTGTVVSTRTRGNQTVTVTFYWINGNLARATRR